MVQPPMVNDENSYPRSESKDSNSKNMRAGLMKLAAANNMNNMKAESKDGDVSYTKDGRARPPRSKGTFGRLLSDVTNEQKSEITVDDERVAVETQCNEALEMASEWIRQDEDEVLAAKVQQDLANEDELKRKLEVSKGESEALNVAIEERRRVQQEAQSKKEREASDVEMAKRTVLDDVEHDHDFKKLCEQDDEVAKKVHQQIQDELLAEELAEKEKNAFEKRQIASRAAESKLVASDFEVARETQIAMDVREGESRMQQEAADSKYALKVAVSSARADHRRTKRLQLVHSPVIFDNIRKVGKQWEMADAEVEDVAGGLCLTLLLPYLRDVKIKSVGLARVDLEACRIVGREEREGGLDTVDNSQYCAEFVIDGKNVRIEDKDLSFEYSSETGLLHVYVENVHLDGPIEDTPSTSTNGRSNGNNGNGRANMECKGEGNGPNNGPNGGIVSTLKNGFRRLFSRKK